MELDEQLATMMDPRTMSLKHLPELDRKKRRDRYAAALKKEYIEYARKATLKHHPEPPAPVDVEVDEQIDKDDEPDEDEVAARRAASALDTGWSDDEEDPPPAAPPPPPPPAAPAPVDWGVAFDKHYRAYRRRMAAVDWRAEFPEMDFPDGELDLINDLISCDITRILDKLVAEDPDRSKYGFLPLMSTGFKGSLGSLLASSFAERINSAANLILTDGNTLLSPAELSMIVVLRMNRRFMEYMRKNYGHLPRQRFKMTVVTQGENANDSDDDDGDTFCSRASSSSSKNKRSREASGGKPSQAKQVGLGSFFRPKAVAQDGASSGGGGGSSGGGGSAVAGGAAARGTPVRQMCQMHINDKIVPHGGGGGGGGVAD